MKKSGRIVISILTVMIIMSLACINVFALNANSLSEGTYSLNASLSCYVNAMGGIEFGEPLLIGSSVKVDNNGNKKMILNFTKSSVTIYNITCDTFIDASPSSTDNNRGVTSGTIGYYDKNGNVQSAEYTLSDDTALNGKDEEVNYVDSITFPVDQITDTYSLTMYINSNVMGVQFCNENDKATEATYSATLTVDWSSLKATSGNTAKSATASNNSLVDEDELETLPDVTKSTEQQTIKETVSVEEDVVEKDGLNIHYVKDENSNDSDNENNTYTAYLNMPALIAVAIGAGVIILIGVAFLVSTLIKKEERKNN